MEYMEFFSSNKIPMKICQEKSDPKMKETSFLKIT